jgi:T-complex protein 1 subunit beta
VHFEGAKVKVDSVQKVAEIEKAEKDKMRSKVNKILKHNIKYTWMRQLISCPFLCSCFISRQLIYNLPEQMFTDAKVTAIEHADFEGVERLVNLLGFGALLTLCFAG